MDFTWSAYSLMWAECGSTRYCSIIWYCSINFSQFSILSWEYTRNCGNTRNCGTMGFQLVSILHYAGTYYTKCGSICCCPYISIFSPFTGIHSPNEIKYSWVFFEAFKKAQRSISDTVKHLWWSLVINVWQGS